MSIQQRESGLFVWWAAFDDFQKDLVRDRVEAGAELGWKDESVSKDLDLSLHQRHDLEMLLLSRLRRLENALDFLQRHRASFGLPMFDQKWSRNNGIRMFRTRITLAWSHLNRCNMIGMAAGHL